jgi:chromosome segregation ATPase
MANKKISKVEKVSQKTVENKVIEERMKELTKQFDNLGAQITTSKNRINELAKQRLQLQAAYRELEKLLRNYYL